MSLRERIMEDAAELLYEVALRTGFVITSTQSDSPSGKPSREKWEDEFND